jgi:hypothetical protein
MNDAFYKLTMLSSNREMFVRESYISHIIENVGKHADQTEYVFSNVFTNEGESYVVKERPQFLVSLTFRKHVIALIVGSKQRVFIFESSFKAGFDTKDGSKIIVGKSKIDIDLPVSKILGSDAVLKM